MKPQPKVVASLVLVAWVITDAGAASLPKPLLPQLPANVQTAAITFSGTTPDLPAALTTASITFSGLAVGVFPARLTTGPIEFTGLAVYLPAGVTTEPITFTGTAKTSQ
jgi:hypothetical protein